MVFTTLDIFSGIGGFSLGLASTGGFRTVAFCEIEPFPRAVLRKHWPDVPIHEDVRELRGETVGRVDMICGGFPCQDISVAGKGAGLHGSRSSLWFEAARLVGELGPRWCLFENVGALRTRGIDRVCSDLEAQGYAVWPLVVGAWAVGAPHRRERVWIVAHRAEGLALCSSSHGAQSGLPLLAGQGKSRGRGGRGGAQASELDNSDAGRRERQEHALQAGRDEPERATSGVGLADRHSRGFAGERSSGLFDGERTASGHDTDGRGERPVGNSKRDGLRTGWRAGAEVIDEGCPPRWPARPGEPQHEWEAARLVGHATNPRRECWSSVGHERDEEGIALPSKRRGEGGSEQPLGGAAHGLPERLARRANREALKALGNSVVPQVVAAIGRAILAAEAELTRGA